MKITLSYSDLTKTVQRSLSIIGKRSTDADGKLLFTDITLGTLEEPILTDFFREAMVSLKTATNSFLTAQVTDQYVTLTFPANHKDESDTTIQEAFRAYCVSYALHSWFTIVAPRLADKYAADVNRHQSEIIRLIYHKEPPK